MEEPPYEDELSGYRCKGGFACVTPIGDSDNSRECLLLAQTADVR